MATNSPQPTALYDAAPDLLVTLKALVAWAESACRYCNSELYSAEDNQEIVDARAAIAKAEGRS